MVHYRILRLTMVIFCLALTLGLSIRFSSVEPTHALHFVKIPLTKSYKMAPPSRACGTWTTVPTPYIIGGSSLTDISALSATNVWAVGFYGGNYSQALFEHWNGTVWTVIASPSIGTVALRSIWATSSSDVWAVGSINGTNNLNQMTIRTLIEHWNGTAWSVVPSPSPGTTNGGTLSGITALSAKDAWAVGNFASADLNETLIEHWDGKQWSVTPSPNRALQPNFISSITAFSAHDVWAVGASAGNPLAQTLIEHWNGKIWEIVSGPYPNGAHNGEFVEAVRVPHTRSLWVLGTIGYSEPFIESWNGRNWSTIPAPVPVLGLHIEGFTVASSRNAWVVGYYYNNDTSSWQTLVEHWDGNIWTVVASPSPSTNYSDLHKVVQVPNTSQVWAIGLVIPSKSALIEFYC